MSSDECLKEGVVVGDLLARIGSFSRAGDRVQVVETARQLEEVVKTTSCVATQIREKVNNEVDALVSFAENHDAVGVDQAVDALR